VGISYFEPFFFLPPFSGSGNLFHADTCSKEIPGLPQPEKGTYAYIDLLATRVALQNFIDYQITLTTVVECKKYGFFLSL
jgi:hypothetical protein